MKVSSLGSRCHLFFHYIERLRSQTSRPRRDENKNRWTGDATDRRKTAHFKPSSARLAARGLPMLLLKMRT